MDNHGLTLAKEPVVLQFNPLPAIQKKTRNELKKEFLSFIQEGCLVPSKIAKHLAIPQRLANYWLKKPHKSASNVKQYKSSENKHSDPVYHDITIPLDKTEWRLKRNDFSTLEERFKWASYWLRYSNMDFATNCLFIGHTRLYSHDNRENVLVMTAFTAHGVVKVEAVRNQPDEACFQQFVHQTLDTMDRDCQLKTYYLITPHDSMANQIVGRGYRYICLPHFSPDLNPMEQFWSACQNQLIDLLEKSAFISRMVDVCYRIRLIDLQCFCQYSMSVIENCVNKIPI